MNLASLVPVVRGKSLTYRLHLYLFCAEAKPRNQSINKLGLVSRRLAAHHLKHNRSKEFQR